MQITLRGQRDGLKASPESSHNSCCLRLPRHRLQAEGRLCSGCSLLPPRLPAYHRACLSAQTASHRVLNKVCAEDVKCSNMPLLVPARQRSRQASGQCHTSEWCTKRVAGVSYASLMRLCRASLVHGCRALQGGQETRKTREYHTAKDVGGLTFDGPEPIGAQAWSSGQPLRPATWFSIARRMNLHQHHDSVLSQQC